MNCSDARHLIHLDVGNDLRADEDRELASHMDRCAECRSYHAGMSSAMNALMVLRDAPSAESDRDVAGGSVWPAVSREIRRRQMMPARTGKFNLHVAALSVCSLSLAVVTIVQSLNSMRSSMEPSGFAPAQSVSRQTSWSQRAPYPREIRQSSEGAQHGDREPAFPGSEQTLPQSF